VLPVSMYVSFFLLSWGGVRLGPLRTSATAEPRMVDGDECRAVGAVIGRGN
jgi:hypothetical protein